MNGSVRLCSRVLHIATCVALATLSHTALANEDIEFVAEHLAEVPMDNRYAALPVWGTGDPDSWSLVGQAGYEITKVGNLMIAGPMFSVAVSHNFSQGWSLGGFGFIDALTLTGDNDYRPLQTSFAPTTPIVRPVDARFDNLNGTMRHYGAGVYLSQSTTVSWLGSPRWTGGVLWQQIALRDYRLNYLVLAGSSAGTQGQIDFDADYTHVTPFIGLEWSHRWERWSLGPHMLFALPLPRRGVEGHITGPGFDLHGNTDEVGAGKHFGDPSLTIGMDLTYEPAHFTIDVGTLVTQYLLEPFIHKGIDANWLLTCRWRS